MDMQNLMLELQPYLINALITILGATGTWLGTLVGKWIKEKVDTEEKKKIVETTCKYVQQVYKDLDGQSKLEKAKEAIIEQLNNKGIIITDLELRVLIESTVHSFKSGVIEGATSVIEEEPIEGITTETDQLLGHDEEFEVDGIVDPEIPELEEEINEDAVNDGEAV